MNFDRGDGLGSWNDSVTFGIIISNGFRVIAFTNKYMSLGEKQKIQDGRHKNRNIAKTELMLKNMNS